MTVAATTSTPTTAQSTITSGQTGLNTDYNSFLKLLTTQLKNQDPLSPMDTNTFTQQLVAMNGVQQQLLTNNLLTSLVGQGSSAATAVNLIGKQVQAQSATATMSGGAVDWTYELGGNAAAATVQVLDSSNKVVYSGAAPDLTKGQHDFKWNGTTSSGGKALAGDYTLKVLANDSALKTIDTNVFVTGVVTGVQQTGGSTQLNLGSTTVDFGNVTTVKNPATTASTSTN
jgi:flagellar basal-body rod modification protein FlgD